MNKNEIKLQRIIKIAGFLGILIAPPYAFYWKHKTQKRFEDSVRDDLTRIKNKGKTLMDIPQKQIPEKGVSIHIIDDE